VAAGNYVIGQTGWKSKPDNRRKHRKYHCLTVIHPDWELAREYGEKHCDPPQAPSRILTHGYRLYLAELAKRMRAADAGRKR